MNAVKCARNQEEYDDISYFLAELKRTEKKALTHLENLKESSEKIYISNSRSALKRACVDLRNECSVVNQKQAY